MATYWRHFRVSGDVAKYPDHAFSFEIHHGGYWQHLDNDRRRYKGGSVHFLDGVDPDQCCWVECNNIAWDLGYRVRPISYWYKLPRCAKTEGFHRIDNDTNAIEMTKHIPPRKRVMQLFITGGGPRKIKEAELEDEKPKPQDWHNPLNLLLPSELTRMNKEEVNNGVERIQVMADFEVSKNDELAIVEVSPNGFVGDTNDVVENDYVIENDDVEGYAADDDLLMEKSAKVKKAVKGKAKVVDGDKSKKAKGRKSAKAKQYNTRFKGEKSFEEVDLEDQTTDEEDKEFFIESDFEQNNADDEIFFEEEIEEPNAIEEFAEMGYAGEISDDFKGSDEDITSCEGSEIEEDENGNWIFVRSKKERKFKKFNKETDMKNPVFVIGMTFPDAKTLRDAIREYFIINRKKVWFELNRKDKVQVKCGWSNRSKKKNKKDNGNASQKKKNQKNDCCNVSQENMGRVVCPWKLYASKYDDEHPNSLMIKSLIDDHKCGGVRRVYHLSSTWMAKKYVHEWRLNPNWTVEGFQKQVSSDYGMSISQQMVYRTKNKAAELNAGAYRDQYNKLESYAAEIRRSNPNSSVYIHSEMEGDVRKFKRIYICWDACKKGFLAGCRQLIGFDGCHIKSAYPGQLLSAVGIDANNGMFPIAYAVVELENKETWMWFMELLVRDLEIVNDTRYIIISDKQKGLLPAADIFFPHAEHRHCVRHLYNNFKADFPGIGLKQLLWAAARDTTEFYWRKHMEEMKVDNWFAWEWLAKKDPRNWSKAFFNGLCKCDLLVNNLCESFNSSILKSRDKPILPQLEMIRINLMVRMANRRNAGAKWNGGLGPRIQKIMKKLCEKSCNYNTAEGSRHQFQVTGKENNHMQAVDLAKRTCTCRKWDITGIPCQHAIAAIYVKDQDPAGYVNSCYSQKKYLDAYDPIIHPIAGEDQWPIVVAPLEPPAYRPQPGRPKKLRIREPGEVEPPAQSETILKRTFFIKVKCGFCKIKGHNVRGCPKKKAVDASSSQPDGSCAQGASQGSGAKSTATTPKTGPNKSSRKSTQSQKPAVPKTIGIKRPQSQPQTHLQAKVSGAAKKPRQINVSSSQPCQKKSWK